MRHHWWSREALASVSGKEGVRRGRRSEERLLAALCNVPSEEAPLWYVATRKATASEDYRGVDFVIYATNGDEYLLQVKSSYLGKLEFLYRRLSIPEERRLTIGVVVIHRNDTPAKIRRKVFEALHQARKESMDKQEA